MIYGFNENYNLPKPITLESQHEVTRLNPSKRPETWNNAVKPTPIPWRQKSD
jgi:hypothetical protein